MTTHRIVVEAPAKVNLYLGVKPGTHDGFHDVETILHTIALHDTLTVGVDNATAVSSGFHLVCDPPVDIPVDKNLVTRAAYALAEAFSRELVPDDGYMEVHLAKRIPMKAGLGGGSSDAAAMIVALCTLWNEDPLDSRCLAVASSLGSDVPFFLYGGCARMLGKGDRFVERYEPLDAPAVIVNAAGSGVSTSACYRAFDEAPITPPGSDRIVAALRGAQPGEPTASQRAADAACELYNNLEPAACTVNPTIARHLDWLFSRDEVLGSLLSGSGSAAFALCASDTDARRVADDATAAGFLAWPTRFTARGAYRQTT